MHDVGNAKGCTTVPFGASRGSGPTVYPGGVQTGGLSLAHVVSCLVDIHDYERVLSRGIHSAGTGSILMVPRAIADGCQNLLAYDVRGRHLKVCHLVSPVPLRKTLERACVSDDTQRVVDSESTSIQQRQCAKLLIWLIKVAKVPRWKVLSTIREVRGESTKLNNHLGLEMSIMAMSDSIGDSSWHWTMTCCEQLTNQVSKTLYTALVSEYMDGKLSVNNQNTKAVNFRISTNPLLGVNYITTAVLTHWGMTLPPSCIYERWGPEDDVTTLDVTVAPDMFKELKLPNVQFELVKSDVLAVVIAGTESLTWDQHLHQCLDVETTFEEAEDNVGYAMMMTSEANVGNYGFMSETGNPSAAAGSRPAATEPAFDPDPEPRFVSAHERFVDKRAFNIYREWTYRHPHRARDQYAFPNTLEERMTSAAETMAVHQREMAGPAPLKYRAAKGLQNLMHLKNLIFTKTQVRYRWNCEQSPMVDTICGKLVSVLDILQSISDLELNFILGTPWVSARARGHGLKKFLCLSLLSSPSLPYPLYYDINGVVFGYVPRATY